MKRPSLLALLEADATLPLAEYLLELHSRETQRVTAMWVFEHEHWSLAPGAVVVGTDEVGRGPLAGPLGAAAVAFREPCHIPGLNDSKKLSPRERELIAVEVRRKAMAWSLGCVSVDAISDGNLHYLSLGAMQQAITGLKLEPTMVLVDGCHRMPGVPWSQQPIVKGDSLSASIAAASIIAKVARDEMMDHLHRQYPHYGWASNRGYGTAEHLEALTRLGPTPAHRRNFRPVRESLEGHPGKEPSGGAGSLLENP
jgi:ribonuclease HII